MSLLDTLLGGAQGPVTQPFGPSNLSGEPAYDGYAHYHEGVDIGVPEGTPLAAPVSGTVTTAGLQSFGGGTNVVTITDAGGTTYSIYHLSNIAVKVGQIITAGSLIGASGGEPGTYGAGYSDGPHVHFQIGVNGSQWVDPLSYVPGNAANATPGGATTLPVSLVGDAAGMLLDKIASYVPALVLGLLGIGLVAIGALRWAEG